jgi:hypothetical protein
MGCFWAGGCRNSFVFLRGLAAKFFVFGKLTAKSFVLDFGGCLAISAFLAKKMKQKELGDDFE